VEDGGPILPAAAAAAAPQTHAVGEGAVEDLESPSESPRTPEDVLRGLPAGASVAMMVLAGSLNPVTRGHIQMLEEGRKLLVDPGVCGEQFDAVVAVVACNSDGWIRRKLKGRMEPMWFPKAVREMMIREVTADLPWILLPLDGRMPWTLHPDLSFTTYYLNGADDVVKYAKWHSASDDPYADRHITIGRAGFTEDVRRGLEEHIQFAEQSGNVDAEVVRRNFLLGPELADYSSTAAREYALSGDRERLLTVVHPEVADRLLGLAKGRSSPRPRP